MTWRNQNQNHIIFLREKQEVRFKNDSKVLRKFRIVRYLNYPLNITKHEAFKKCPPMYLSQKFLEIMLHENQQWLKNRKIIHTGNSEWKMWENEIPKRYLWNRPLKPLIIWSRRVDNSEHMLPGNNPVTSVLLIILRNILGLW